MSCDFPPPDRLEKAKNNPRLEPYIHTTYPEVILYFSCLLLFFVNILKGFYEKFKHYIFPGIIFGGLKFALFMFFFVLQCVTQMLFFSTHKVSCLYFFLYH
jgi:hypothetical protein